MKTFWQYLSTLIFLLYFFSCTEKKDDYLFSETEEKGKYDLKLHEAIIKTQNIHFNPALLKEKKELKARLFDKDITILLDEKYPPSKSGLLARVKGAKEYNYIMITQSNGVYAANMLIDNRFYQIRYLGNNVYQLREVNQGKFEESNDTVSAKTEPQIARDPCANTDPADFIDLMVLYTDDARTAAGGKDEIEAEIYLAVEETNMAYFNSQITQRIRLVRVGEVDYNETGNPNTDLSNLAGTSDGILDNIHALRDTHAADLVSLITETNSGGCGIAYVMSAISTNFENNAFSVVKRSCATGNFSFGHELGHNMGCQHNCENSPGLTPAAYAHGLTVANGSNEIRTVLAYASDACKNNPNCTSTRFPFFSNPNINFPGTSISTGNTAGVCRADNHRLMNETAITVANFRCHSSRTQNVWMKDSWNDTGAEPDPATAGEDMWLSPYIWVRNSRDAEFAHQHQHENPEVGTSSNWVYAKLHNGGSAAAGKLKLYYANAGVSLSWPGSWTEIAAHNVNIAANTSRIEEFEWSTLPGTGHYCLLARWESPSDPMAFAEGPDIHENTRRNNNIIWRNLNIVDLTQDDQDVTFNYTAYKNSRIHFSFKSKKFPYQPFLPNGEILVNIGNEGRVKTEYDGFDKNSQKGFYKISRETASVTLYGNGENGKATFRLKKNNLPKGRYWLDVSQTIEGKRIGGVSYEIINELQ